MTFIDNGINPANGMIELGATFPNPDERLWPGRYVLVRLALAVQHNAVVAPVRAIQTDGEGQYVFAVRGDRTVELRRVKVTRTAGDEAVIEAGLQPGEPVVTDGQLQLADGVQIDDRTAEGAHSAEPAASPAASRRGAP